MKKENEDNKIIYIGIGVFLWLTIGGFSVLFENIFKDILLNINNLNLNIGKLRFQKRNFPYQKPL